MTKRLTVFSLFSTLVMAGCATTSTNNEYPNLAVVDNELGKSKWEQLERFPARYPQHAVINSQQGCATVEYVITPNNEIKDISVVKSTNSHFASVAKDVVNRWKWSELPKNVIAEPVKTQTRFDFCFNAGTQNCELPNAEYACPGEDVIYSRGMKIQ